LFLAGIRCSIPYRLHLAGGIMRPRTWVLTLVILALFLHVMPYNWLVFIPIVTIWLFWSMAIAGFIMLFVSERFDE
jgi:hypothetical protein